MDAYRLNLKLYFSPDIRLDREQIIPIFHRWIRDNRLDEMLIDVADYSLVPSGPGVMLIAHEAHYSLDATDGELGLLYARKRPQAGSFGERLRDAWQKLLTAGQQLEQEAGLVIPTDRLDLRIQDRLLAPNNDATAAAVEPELRRLVSEYYGDVDLDLTPEADARAGFGLQAQTPVSPRIAALLAAGPISETATRPAATTWQPGELAGRQVFGRPQKAGAGAADAAH